MERKSCTLAIRRKPQPLREEGHKHLVNKNLVERNTKQSLGNLEGADRTAGNCPVDGKRKHNTEQMTTRSGKFTRPPGKGICLHIDQIIPQGQQLRRKHLIGQQEHSEGKCTAITNHRNSVGLIPQRLLSSSRLELEKKSRAARTILKRASGKRLIIQDEQQNNYETAPCQGFQG